MINRKKIVGIDFNSTLQDQIGEICRRTILQPSDFDRWDPLLGCRVGMTEAAFCKWAWCDESIQAMAQPYPGAARAVAKLAETCKIWIVTSTSNPLLLPGWLRRHGFYPDRIILTDDKGGVEWDWLVDDRPDVLERLSGEGRNVLRHKVEWNKHLVDIRGISWQ